MKATSRQAKELKAGDIAWLKAYSGFGHALDSSPDWYKIKGVSRQSSSGGCRVSVSVEGFDRPFCWLRGSSKVRVQEEVS